MKPSVAPPDYVTLFSNSWNYLQALRMLTPADEDHHSLRPGVALLAGFSIELALKAILSVCGWSDDELRDLGHDLRGCLKRSRACGLVVSDGDGLEFVLKRCAGHHKRLTLRYIPSDMIETKLPRAETAIRVIDALHDDILSQFAWLKDNIHHNSDEPGGRLKTPTYLRDHLAPTSLEPPVHLGLFGRSPAIARGAGPVRTCYGPVADCRLDILRTSMCKLAYFGPVSVSAADPL